MAATCAGCWGDRLPALDQVGALRGPDGAVTILFGACPGEGVRALVVSRTDEKHTDTLGALWAVEADQDGSAVSVFTIGRTPPGFREVTALDDQLDRGDHLQVVVTSTRRGTIPMSFDVQDLRSDEVLVRRTRYYGQAEFEQMVDQRCEDS